MKKKIPKKITLDNLENSAIKYLEKYSVSEYHLITILRRKIIKTSFFYKTKPEKDFQLIKLIINKFKKIGLIDDKKFSENKTLIYMERGYSRKKIAKSGKEKYMKYFNSTVVADYIINNTFDISYKKNKYMWSSK